MTVSRCCVPFRRRTGVLAALLMISALACYGEERKPRVLLIGIDGASPRIVELLMQSGRLPNLRRIADAGTWGPLRSSFPLLSPRVWTTIATGKGDDKHGIRGWVRPVGKNRTRLYYSSDRKGLALWNMLSASGLSVAVVNWLITYPPERVHGVMVSDHVFTGKEGGWKMIGKLFSGDRVFEPPPRGSAAATGIYPEAWVGRVHAPEHFTDRPSSLPDPASGDGEFKYPELVPGYSKFYAIDQRIGSVALEIEAALRPELLMVLFQGIDRISHHLWAGFEEPSRYPPERRYTAAQAERARATLEAYYQFSDDLIGLLLSRFSEDDLVLVVSDHGFEAGGKGVLTGVHDTPAALDGVIFARGRHVRPRSSGETIRIEDVTPTVLAWLGLPLGRDMDGKAAAFLDLDSGETIPTWDTFEVERAKNAASGADGAILEQLKSLGYVE